MRKPSDHASYDHLKHFCLFFPSLSASRPQDNKYINHMKQSILSCFHAVFSELFKHHLVFDVRTGLEMYMKYICNRTVPPSSVSVDGLPKEHETTRDMI